MGSRDKLSALTEKHVGLHHFLFEMNGLTWFTERKISCYSGCAPCLKDLAMAAEFLVLE